MTVLATKNVNAVIVIGAAAIAVFAGFRQAPAVQINEIRIDQPSVDNSEYFELVGTPGELLEDLWYVTLGDAGPGDSGANGYGNSGAVETVVSLSGTMPEDGFLLVAESTFENGAGGLFEGITPDVTAALNFENGDNVTHLLVTEFTGSTSDDLDPDDDGTLDTNPWTLVIDAIGLVEKLPPPAAAGDEWAYGVSLGFSDLGPDGSRPPSHVFRSPDGGSFLIGMYDDFVNDTPGGPNPSRPFVIGDMDCDGDVDFDDIDDFVLGLNDPQQYESTFGIPPSLKGDTDGDEDLDFDDIPGFVDILGGGGTETVPEPSTALLVATGVLAMLSLKLRPGCGPCRAKR
jgi:hypothetical protein